MSDLQSAIEQAFEQRADITPASANAEVREAVDEVMNQLDAGTLRVAEKRDGDWRVNEWAKKAVLLSFRLTDNYVMDAGSTAQYFDKVPLKFHGFSAEQHQASGVRVVPPAVARRGSYIAPGVVMMPSYVNLGAYVDSGTMVDTWATVGSCAQIGKNVHLSGGVGLAASGATAGIANHHRGRLFHWRPLGDCGASSSKRLGRLNGCLHRAKHAHYDRETGEILYGRVLAGSVVVSGNLPAADGSHSLPVLSS